jgi:hypothetical protein
MAVVADAQEWGWRADLCPERAAVCKREFARGQGGRKRQEIEEWGEDEAGEEGNDPAQPSSSLQEGGSECKEVAVLVGGGEQGECAEKAEQRPASGDDEQGEETGNDVTHGEVDGKQGSFNPAAASDITGEGELATSAALVGEGIAVEVKLGAAGAAAAGAAAGECRVMGADVGAKRCRVEGMREADDAADAVEGPTCSKRLRADSSGIDDQEEGSEMEQQQLENGKQDQSQQQQEQPGDAAQAMGYKKSRRKGAADGIEDAWQKLPADALLRHGGRWLLLSFRAVSAGPPGCYKAPLFMEGPLEQARLRFESSAATYFARDGLLAPLQRAGSEGGRSKRVFKGLTPKCGVCNTCRNPQMKKACLINRERLAQGLAPVTGAALSGK